MHGEEVLAPPKSTAAALCEHSFQEFISDDWTSKIGGEKQIVSVSNFLHSYRLAGT
jgi:hypothetical protein